MLKRPTFITVIIIALVVLGLGILRNVATQQAAQQEQ